MPIKVFKGLGVYKELVSEWNKAFSAVENAQAVDRDSMGNRPRIRIEPGKFVIDIS